MASIFDEDTVTELVHRGEDISFEKAIALFETIYMASRNLAERTRVEYRTDVAQLGEFLNRKGITRPTAVGLPHLQAFLAELDAKGLSGVTRRRKTASIKALFGFLTASGLISRNSARELIPPEREYKEPRFLTAQEYALFVTKFREPIGPRAIQRLVEKYLKEAGIRHASIHTLRHTFATHHVAKGTDLRTVQEALGHADLKTTSIYVSMAKEAMKRELQDHAL
jgi:site-specific recombinase XerD